MNFKIRNNKIIIIVFIIAGILALSIVVKSAFVLKDVCGLKKSSEIIVSVPEGAVASDISKILEKI